MRRFKNIRLMPWEPEFLTVFSSDEAADYINRVHEDYPDRIPMTKMALDGLVEELSEVDAEGIQIHEALTKVIHGLIFSDQSFAGHWRGVPVLIGNHRPPNPELVPKFMTELSSYARIDNTDDLLDWYWDFETIHPFQDGNGRVGGVILAGVSYFLSGAYIVPDEVEDWDEDYY